MFFPEKEGPRVKFPPKLNHCQQRDGSPAPRLLSEGWRGRAAGGVRRRCGQRKNSGRCRASRVAGASSTSPRPMVNILHFCPEVKVTGSGAQEGRGLMVEEDGRWGGEQCGGVGALWCHPPKLNCKAGLPGRDGLMVLSVRRDD